MRHTKESPVDASDADAPSSSRQRGIAPRLFLILFALVTGLISYGLSFVWPGDDPSPVYLPRFLPSAAIAGVLLKCLRLWPAQPQGNAASNDAGPSD